MSRAVVNNTSSPLLVTRPQPRAVAVVERRGADGAPGTDKSYTHDQSTPAATWVVAHNLGKVPSVTVVTTSGDEVEGAIRHDDNNNLTITFGAAFGGRAYCN